MNHHDPLRESPVKQALKTTQKKTTKTISLPSTSAKPLTTLAFIRNAAVGMALIYLEQLEAIWRPLAFSMRHSVVYFIALLHIFIPLLATWFATHWSAQIEQAMWGNSEVLNAVSFVAAWLVLLLAWSLIWLALRSFVWAASEAVDRLCAIGNDSSLIKPIHHTKPKI